MNCHEVQNLCGLHLDSELDAKTSLEVEQHLAACAACARFFAAATQSERRLRAALRQGAPTPALWANVEALVRQAGRAAAAEDAPARIASAEPWWQVWLWPSPRFYVGVAAVWIALLALNFTTREARESAVATSPAASPATRAALTEQRRELAELLDLPVKTAQVPKPEAEPPRSQRGLNRCISKLSARPICSDCAPTALGAPASPPAEDPGRRAGGAPSLAYRQPGDARGMNHGAV